MTKSKFMLFLLFAITFISTIILFSTKGKNWQGIESMIFPALLVACSVTVFVFALFYGISKLSGASRELAEKHRPIAETYLKPWISSGELKYDGQLVGGYLRYSGKIKNLDIEIMVRIIRPKNVELTYQGFDYPIEISVTGLRIKPLTANTDINFLVQRLNNSFSNQNLRFQNSLGWIYSHSQILFIGKDQKAAITPEDFQKLFKEMLGSL